MAFLSSCPCEWLHTLPLTEFLPLLHISADHPVVYTASTGDATTTSAAQKSNDLYSVPHSQGTRQVPCPCPMLRPFAWLLPRVSALTALKACSHVPAYERRLHGIERTHAVCGIDIVHWLHTDCGSMWCGGVASSLWWLPAVQTADDEWRWRSVHHTGPGHICIRIERRHIVSSRLFSR